MKISVCLVSSPLYSGRTYMGFKWQWGTLCHHYWRRAQREPETLPALWSRRTWPRTNQCGKDSWCDGRLEGPASSPDTQNQDSMSHSHAASQQSLVMGSRLQQAYSIHNLKKHLFLPRMWFGYCSNTCWEGSWLLLWGSCQRGVSAGRTCSSHWAPSVSHERNQRHEVHVAAG